MLPCIINGGGETAMKYYDNLILKLDADSISMLYKPGGNLGDIAIGCDSIKKFLSSFKNVRVLSQSSIIKSKNNSSQLYKRELILRQI